MKKKEKKEKPTFLFKDYGMLFFNYFVNTSFYGNDFVFFLNCTYLNEFSSLRITIQNTDYF